MTGQQFDSLSEQSETPLPILLADGRMGLCIARSNAEVLIDAYRGNDHCEVWLPLSQIAHVAGGALIEDKPAAWKLHRERLAREES